MGCMLGLEREAPRLVRVRARVRVDARARARVRVRVLLHARRLPL